jgi:spore germination protein GerM
MSRRLIVATAIVGLGFVLGALILVGILRSSGQKPAARTAAAAAPGSAPAASTASAARKITATLFYVSDDGMTLTGVQREVPFADGVPLQARAIIEAQLAPAPPLLSAIPSDTKLRDVFVTDRGDAFVDLSPEVSTHHSGGSLDELLTIYTIVNALTTNLPAITHVQILIEGKEVETLAGHVDLRHPLAKGLQWIAAHDSH